MSGAPIEYVREGLHRMADALHPEDRVTLVTFSDSAVVHAEAAAGDSPELLEAIDAIAADGQTNVYAGLRAAYRGGGGPRRPRGAEPSDPFVRWAGDHGDRQRSAVADHGGGLRRGGLRP